MERITKKEFNALEVVNGIKRCPPNTDYSLIFDFGKRCSFGEGCSISQHKIKGFKIRSISGLGEYKRTLYVWDTEDGFYFQAGCRFSGKEEFYAACIDKYGEDCTYIKASEFLISDWD